MITSKTSLDVKDDTILAEIFGPVGNPPAIGVRRNRTIVPSESDALYEITTSGTATVVLEGCNTPINVGVYSTEGGTFSREIRPSTDPSDWTEIATHAGVGPLLTTSGAITAPQDYIFLRLRVSVPGTNAHLWQAAVTWD